MLSSEQIKKDFPFFNKEGNNLIFLDNAATTQKPGTVIEAISDFYTNHNSNVHRGIYRLSEEATDLYWHSRENVSSFIGSKDPRQLVFVRNATEALNLLAYTLGKGLKSGDEVLLTIMEHHSNIVPWQFLLEKGVKIRYADITPDGRLDLDDLENKLNSKTKIVSVTQTSNLLGTINDVSKIGKIAHDNGSLFIVDGAQSVPHMPVNVVDQDCDFMAFSGHKMLGPMGIGALYGKFELLKSLPPFNGGGEMITEVYTDHAVWAEVPEKFEAGTPNVGGAVGFSAAVDYLRKLGMENVREHEKDLIGYTLRKEEKEEIKGLISYGPRNEDERGGIYSFNLGEMHPMTLEESIGQRDIDLGSSVHPHDVGTEMDRENIAVRAGHHCAMPLTHRLNVVATSRASYYVYNSRSDVDALFEAMKVISEAYL